MPTETAILDDLDAKIIRCIQLAPRIPFRAAGEILGVSEQTIARRYRRLVRDGVLRVTAVVNPDALGQSSWVIRVRCRPSGATSLARALSQRDDVSWVTLMSGGSEVVCVLRSRTSEARDDLLIEKLPRTAPVLDIEAAMVLHGFVGGDLQTIDDWSALADRLDPAQQDAVAAWSDRSPRADRPTVALSTEDLQLLDALADDGRASFAALGQASGSGETRAARRLRALIDSGVVYLDVDLSAKALGFGIQATLWLTATPAELENVGAALAAEAEVAYAAAITGRHNVMAAVTCRDVRHLYEFVRAKVGAVPGVASMELTPVLRHMKQAGAMTTGTRLVPPDEREPTRQNRPGRTDQ